VDGNQKNSATVKATETRLEKMDERHLNFAECDGFNFHLVRKYIFTTE
jgi:hypothetical protein